MMKHVYKPTTAQSAAENLIHNPIEQFELEKPLKVRKWIPRSCYTISFISFLMGITTLGLSLKSVNHGHVGVYHTDNLIRDPGLHFNFPWNGNLMQINIGPQLLNLNSISTFNSEGIKCNFTEVNLIYNVTDQKSYINSIKTHGIKDFFTTIKKIARDSISKNFPKIDFSNIKILNDADKEIIIDAISYDLEKSINLDSINITEILLNSPVFYAKDIYPSTIKTLKDDVEKIKIQIKNIKIQSEKNSNDDYLRTNKFPSNNYSPPSLDMTLFKKLNTLRNEIIDNTNEITNIKNSITNLEDIQENLTNLTTNDIIDIKDSITVLEDIIKANITDLSKPIIVKQIELQEEITNMTTKYNYAIAVLNENQQNINKNKKNPLELKNIA